ncbi:MAG: FAD-dependent oxidoreductase [Solirubrobacterales bacterium]
MLAAAVDSAGHWPDFAAEIEADAGLPVPYRRCGSCTWGSTATKRPGCGDFTTFTPELGLEARWLRERVPAAPSAGLTTAVTGGYEASPARRRSTPERCWSRCGRRRCRGVELHEGEVAGLLLEGDRCAGARLEGGRELRAPRTLAALGARLGGEVLPPEVRPPIRPVKGEVLRLRAGSGAAPCERVIASERVYVVPRASGDVVIGATMEDRGFDLRVTAGGVHELLREAYRAVPEVAASSCSNAGPGCGRRPPTTCRWSARARWRAAPCRRPPPPRDHARARHR